MKWTIAIALSLLAGSVSAMPTMDRSIIESNMQETAQAIAYASRCQSSLSPAQTAQMVDNYAVAEYLYAQNRIQENGGDIAMMRKKSQRSSERQIRSVQRQIDKRGCKTYGFMDGRAKQIAGANMRQLYLSKHPRAYLPKAATQDEAQTRFQRLGGK